MHVSLINKIIITPIKIYKKCLTNSYTFEQRLLNFINLSHYQCYSAHFAHSNTETQNSLKS